MEQKTFKPHDITKIASISAEEVSQETIDVLEESAEYNDNVHKEHLLNVGQLVYQIEAGEIEVSMAVKSELESLQQMLNENDCAYLRLIYW